MSNKTVERNFYAYQVDFQELAKVEKDKEVFRDIWDIQSFNEMLTGMMSKHINDLRVIHNGWFLMLDKFKQEKITFKVKGKEITKKYIVGRFLYAEFGYVGGLWNVDTLSRRENTKKPREGEEKFVYFYIREDGLLLLQGDMKVIRSKVENYFQTLGKEYMDNRNIYGISISTLLRGDFIDEVKKLDAVNKIEIELAVEKASSYENEVLLTAKNQAQDFEANYATLTMQSKYKKTGLSGFEGFLNKIKPKGTKAPVGGVNNIKVIGKQDGEFKRVYLSKISEKYPVSVKVDENNNILEEDMYNKVKEMGKRRESLWREDGDGKKD
ncbi:hypothetical protein LS684_21015 (plasmid) [Cytobacillus spongiae]|uniref:hypothetical protein n=1 Tax=Cytobacillus spongiae TaxID=2901381 RepID=UPI001F4804AF|nr:hypothetical protein [Cytobacillus spongiae]UII58107.1 hypothetical protein LS684_21015 [Cytobacillus spongiae]